MAKFYIYNWIYKCNRGEDTVVMKIQVQCLYL